MELRDSITLVFGDKANIQTILPTNAAEALLRFN